LKNIWIIIVNNVGSKEKNKIVGWCVCKVNEKILQAEFRIRIRIMYENIESFAGFGFLVNVVRFSEFSGLSSTGFDFCGIFRIL
jgi:hypothetical protein